MGERPKHCGVVDQDLCCLGCGERNPKHCPYETARAPQVEQPGSRERVKELRMQILRVGAPCRSSKHDGVHSDMSCWSCGGTLIDSERAKTISKILDDLTAALSAPKAQSRDLEDARSAYMNLRTCMKCGGDANEHFGPDHCDGFDPDWQTVERDMEARQMGAAPKAQTDTEGERENLRNAVLRFLRHIGETRSIDSLVKEPWGAALIGVMDAAMAPQLDDVVRYLRATRPPEQP